MLMCGVFTGPGGPGAREWNAQLDPHATAMVYRATPPVHRSVGLDVTTRVSLPAPEVRQRFQHPLLRPVLDFAEVWFTSRERITFHDPLAAVALWQPDLCGWTRGTVHVETASPELGGLTSFQPDPAGHHEVALDVNAERFFAAYFEPFGR
jgi:inosine-uridine nucleoside N-ribohydrolase